MTFVFIKLVRYADTYGEDGKLPVPVHILADELANTGAILSLKQKDFRDPKSKPQYFLHFPKPASDAEPVSLKPMAGNHRELRHSAIFRLYG